ETFFFELRQEKPVWWLESPAAVANRGRLHGTYRLPGPVLAPALLEIEYRRARLFRGFSRPGPTHFHPAHQCLHLAVRQAARGRHLQGKIPADGPDQFAIVRPVGNQDRTGVTAAGQGGAAVQLESGEQRLCLAAMTGVTVLRENGPHLRFE